MFNKDNRHLWVLCGLLVAGAIGYLVLRSVLIPPSWGDQGPGFRGDALTEELNLEVKVVGRTQCLNCHEDKASDFEESPHLKVTCVDCHGFGTQHAKKCKDAADAKERGETPAKCFERDKTKEATTLPGNSADLYITTNRMGCENCHRKMVGRPPTFTQIDIKEHFESEEPEEPDSPSVCIECHAAHNPSE